MDEWDEIQRKLDKPFDREIMEREEEQEEWRSAPGFDRYEVSNFGNVRNKRTKRNLSNRIIRRVRTVLLYYGNKQTTTVSVANLVAKTFLPNPHGASTVKHKDGNLDNNHVDNLEWYVPQKKERKSGQSGRFYVMITRDDIDREETFITEKGAKDYICDVVSHPHAGDYVFDNLGRAITFAPNTNPENKKITILALKRRKDENND